MNVYFSYFSPHFCRHTELLEEWWWWRGRRRSGKHCCRSGGRRTHNFAAANSGLLHHRERLLRKRHRNIDDADRRGRRRRSGCRRGQDSIDAPSGGCYCVLWRQRGLFIIYFCTQYLLRLFYCINCILTHV